jgi:hypothetical protein
MPMFLTAGGVRITPCSARWYAIPEESAKLRPFRNNDKGVGRVRSVPDRPERQAWMLARSQRWNVDGCAVRSPKTKKHSSLASKGWIACGSSLALAVMHTCGEPKFCAMYLEVKNGRNSQFESEMQEILRTPWHWSGSATGKPLFYDPYASVPVLGLGLVRWSD